MTNPSKIKKKGEFFALFAYFFWGMLPIYWKHLQSVPTIEILAHRLFWSCIIMVGFFLFTHRSWPEYQSKKRSKRSLNYFSRLFGLCSSLDFKGHLKSILYLSLSAFLIVCNFGLFIWAVNSQDILEVSLSNCIAPLVHIVLGRFFLKEELKPLQVFAVLLAINGVLFLSIEYEHTPWIAIFLSLSFGIYGFLRKTCPLNAVQGFTIETLLLAPFCLTYIIYLHKTGQSHFTWAYPNLMVLLTVGGLMTSIPLLSFTQAARLLDLSRLGFFQFILPSSQFLLAVFVYHEKVTLTYGIGFCLIFSALLVYVLSTCRKPNLLCN